MLLDANEETFELVEIDGKETLFTNSRLDRTTVPEGLFCYDIRESEGFSSEPVTLEPYVMVNHWGTVLSKEEFTLNDEGFYSIDDFNYMGETLSIEEFTSPQNDIDMNM